MKAVASKIVRKERGDLKAIAAAREYQAIFKSNGKPMVIIDHDTTISLANAEFERLSGYTKKEIEGTKKWAEFVAQEDRNRMNEYHLLRKSDPMLAPRCFEFRFVDRYGKIKNIVLTIGEITGTNKSMASLQDVTDRRRAEITQRADEERYKTFFENSRDAVYITTGDGSYVDANRAALDLFGYTREEMKKLKARQLYADPTDARRLKKEIEEKGFAQDFEVRLRKKDGEEMDCLFTVTALLGDDGSILEYQGIARDVTERKRAVEALRKSEERYHDIFDSMHEGYFEVDLAGNFTFFNQPVSKFFGYPQDELMGLNYQKYTSPEEAQRLFQVYNEVYKTGNPHDIGDYEMIKRDGSIGIASFSVSLLRNAAGEPIGFRGVTRDVTEKRKTETTLQQSEENYRKILEMAPDGIAINRLKDERYVLVNDAFCLHTGYRREEIIGRSALELNLFLDRADHELVAKTLRKEGRVEGLEINFWAKDGTILNDLVSARPIRFKGEDCLLVVATNINALKKAEEALRESEERYRSIIEDTEESYFETDLGGNYTFVNDAECKMLGYTREKLIGMNYRQLSHETIANKIYHFFNESYKTGKPIKLMNQEITRKDGTKLIAEVSASLIRDSEGQPIGFRGIARDISKRTQAEEALRESETRYRTLFQTTSDGVLIADIKTKTFRYANPAACRLLGYSEAELTTMGVAEIHPKADLPRVMAEFEALTRGDKTLAMDLPCLRKDGTIIYVDIITSVMTIDDRLCLAGFFRDITERKQSEEVLRKSEEKYRTIIDSIQDGYFENDLAGTFTLVNDSLCRDLGYTKEEFIGMSYQQLRDEANAKKTYQIYNEIYRTGKPISAIAELISKDGTKKITESLVSLIRDVEGKPIGFRGISRDITERKEAEEKLRQSEERYRTIVETMQDGYFENDLAGDLTFANDALCRDLGYTKEELIRMNYRQYTDEKTAGELFRHFNSLYSTGESIKLLEIERIRKDGKKSIAEISTSLIKDALGKPIGFRGIARDITERKQAEERLRQSEEKYRTILETMWDGYWETDLSGAFTFVNEAQCRMTGSTRERLIGMNNQQYTDATTAKKLYALFSKVYKTGEPVRSYEFEYFKRDDTKGFDEISVSLIRDEQGKPIGFRGVSRDVTERKQMEEALRQSEEKYRTILLDIHEGYFEVDLAGTYTFVNDVLCKNFGYTKEELLGTSSLQYQDETSSKKTFEAFNELYRTGKPIQALVSEHIRKDGTRGMYEISASLVRNAQGKPIGFRGTSRDVTERKQMEEDLRQSEEKYRTILETMQEGYYELDLAGNFIFANDAECKNLGYSREELIGMNNRNYQSEEEVKKSYQIFNGIYRTGEPVKGYGFEITKRDGTKAFHEVSVSLIRDAKGKPIGFRGISHDVTERKRAEEALRQSEEKYRTIIETMQEGYFELDLKGSYTFANEALCKRQGYTKDELIGMNNRQFQSETDAQKAYQAFHEVYRTGEPNKFFEMEVIKKDGTKGFSEVSVSLIRDTQDKPIGFRGISHDVTERKQMEEDLRQSEERYRTIVETMQDGYWETDLAGNFTFVNDEECKIAGTPREQLIGRNNQQYTDETTAKKLYEVFKGMHTTGEPVRNCEFEFIRRNGTKAFAEFSASPIKDAQGKPIGFRGVTRDVTERKRAEEALRQSEERYRTILETMHDGYWETDLTGTFTFVNDAQCRMTGSRRERLIGRNDRDYTTKEEAKRLYEIFSGVYRTGEPVSGFAFEYTKKDGTKAYNEVSVSLKRDAEGKPIGFRGISRDVTERKRAEEILRQSEEKYRTILESMQEGYTELDLKGNFTLVNDKVVKDLGYTKEELIGTNSRRYRDGKKEEEIYRRYNELYKTGETIRSLEIVYVSKNGIARTYELTASLIRDEQGKPIGFRAVSRDVTERKQAEEALRQGEEKYRNIIENIQDGYWEVDLTGNFTFVNEAECKITGTPQKQLVNSKIWQYLDETAAKKLYKDFQEIYRTGEPVKSYEFEFIGGDGIKRFGEFSASLIRDAQGKPIGFRGVTRDATERKKAENQLRRYATELERSNEEVKNFAYIVSHDLRVPLVNLKGYTSELRSALGVIGTNFDAALPHLIDEKRSEVAMALHEDVPEALEFITSSVSRMDSFINAVLILSRLGRQDLKPEPIDMNALVQTTLETMSHQIKEQGLEVIVGSLPQVVADRTAMERIVGNILNNAVKYLDSSRPCRIEVAAEVNNGETIFTIHDTGRGIAQEDMHKVFAPFRRAGKQDTQGEGMGLAYVQTLVRRHGGRIWCESELGKGTTFAFTISSAFKQGTSDA